MNVADLIPASSPGEASSSSTSNPRFSAQRISIRSTISAQSWASVPPAPALTVTSAFAGVVGTREQPLLLQLLQALLHAADLLLELAGDVRILLGQLGQRLEVLDVALQLPVGGQAPAGAGVLGADLGRPLLVLPEAGGAHLSFERVEALAQPRGSKIVRKQLELLADRREALGEGL